MNKRSKRRLIALLTILIVLIVAALSDLGLGWFSRLVGKDADALSKVVTKKPEGDLNRQVKGALERVDVAMLESGIEKKELQDPGILTEVMDEAKRSPAFENHFASDKDRGEGEEGPGMPLGPYKRWADIALDPEILTVEEDPYGGPGVRPMFPEKWTAVVPGGHGPPNGNPSSGGPPAGDSPSAVPGGSDQFDLPDGGPSSGDPLASPSFDKGELPEGNSPAAPVPEPATVLLLGMGVFAAAAFKNRNRLSRRDRRSDA